MKTVIDKFRLDAEGNPRAEPDLLEWGRWMETSWPARRVAQTRIHGVRVSTVFLGLDQSFARWLPGCEDLDPVLWETMAFGAPCDLWVRRYSSRIAAIEGHAEVCKLVRRRIARLRRAARKRRRGWA